METLGKLHFFYESIYFNLIKNYKLRLLKYALDVDFICIMMGMLYMHA